MNRKSLEKKELDQIAALCIRYNVILVSDEIHCDFTAAGHTFISAARLSEALLGQAVICTAPSKTFNLAGLQTSNIFIPDQKLRNAFRHQIDAAGYSQLNTMGLLACKTAYREGSDWLYEIREYIKDNLDYLRAYLADNIQQIHLIEPEGTYLAWLDCGGIRLTGNALNRFITEKAGLWLDGGNMFGGQSGLSGRFQRINLACCRDTLIQALEQLREAVKMFDTKTDS